MNIRFTGGTHPLLKNLAAWGIPLWLLTLFAMPAAANFLTSAAATVSCGSKNYTISVCGDDLTPGQTYTVDYTINFTPSGSSTPTTLANSSFSFTPSSSTACSPAKPETFSAPLSGTGTLSGTATLTSSGSTAPIQFSGSGVSSNNQLNCGGPPPPPQCPPCPTSSIQSNFNGTAIPAGDSIWFNAHISVSGIPSSGATIFFTCATVTSSAFTASLPNGEIVFSPSAPCATTTFTNGMWVTTVPISGSDEIFLTGLAFPLPSGLPGGLNPVTLSGIFSASVPGVSLSWQWGAAAYSCFGAPSTSTSPYFSTGFYTALKVKPTHQNACGYNNGDHAGTPENPTYQCAVGGARGGGSGNLTGSWSATGNIPEVCKYP
jgi:hypothetical protein